MDADLNLATAPFRDARFAPRRVEIEHRDNGEIIVSNPTPYSTAFTTTTEALAHWAARTPSATWLAERFGEGWRTISYAEALGSVSAIAGGLRELGVVSERPLLILARNGIDHALIKYAAMSQGMPVAPVSPQYGLPGANLSRLAHAVEVLKPAAIYTEDAELFIAALEAPFLGGLPVIAGKNARAGDVPLERLLKSRPAAPTAQPDDHAKYLLTSGSTGLPKAVICTHRSMAWNAAQIRACFEDDEAPVMVNSAPWSHSLGANSILHMSTHRGGAVYIDAGQPVAGRFAETVRNLKDIAPTYQNMVPAGWMLFAGELERDDDLARTFFSRVRLLQYGGAALGQEINDRIQAVAIRTVGERISFASGYGATETGPTAATVHWHNGRMGLIGLPVPGTTVKLAPSGEKLEFRVKGPQITAGYLGRPDLTAQSRDEEGFYLLGDAARFVDPADPAQGMVFDGRLSENFKLASGTFVTVGDLRVAAVSAIGDAVTDAVVCGENQEGVGLMFYPNPDIAPVAVAAAVRLGLEAFNAKAKGAGGRIGRALVLDGPPDAGAGEITDKGYIAQALARSRRSETVAKLFADPPSSDVMVF
ncbi:feruloyl-CoA synthase [Phenylobacterium sp. 20VBR1]|uniref:Feruloyl-CoA synthase n=1 Tax=Phenylobacterium glaciei TaxID=2803784 RepID=A0A941D3U7_9CAUL|nr:feruloyl-CoA synthase [Phenylobacterium glaciei]MBR7621114.1 feruloyl-CoA synthase [Phenylobacterium glaciei]